MSLYNPYDDPPAIRIANLAAQVMDLSDALDLAEADNGTLKRRTREVERAYWLLHADYQGALIDLKELRKTLKASNSNCRKYQMKLARLKPKGGRRGNQHPFNTSISNGEAARVRAPQSASECGQQVKRRPKQKGARHLGPRREK